LTTGFSSALRRKSWFWASWHVRNGFSGSLNDAAGSPVSWDSEGATGRPRHASANVEPGRGPGKFGACGFHLAIQARLYALGHNVLKFLYGLLLPVWMVNEDISRSSCT